MTTLDSRTPEYVHDLLDTLIHRVPLNFHGHKVPLDVRGRLMRRSPRPNPIPLTSSSPVPAPRPEPAPLPSPPAAPEPAPAAELALEPVAELAPVRAGLTRSQIGVLQGMAEGLSNKDIGARLFISEDTVKTHARRLFRRIGARDRAHAVAIAFRTGVLQ